MILERASLALARCPSKIIDCGDLTFVPPADIARGEGFGGALVLASSFRRDAAARQRSLAARPPKLRSSAVRFGVYPVLPGWTGSFSRARRDRSIARVVLWGALHLLTRSSRGNKGGKDFPESKSAVSTELASWRATSQQ